MFKVRFYFGYNTRPSHIVPQVGRSPFVPLFGSHTRAPIGRTALRACATGSYPKVSPLDDSHSPRAGQFDRTRAHGRTHANVPWHGRDAHGTAHHGTARERAHTLPAGPLRPALRPSIRPTRLRCRLPLLTASACRARAQRKLQPTKMMWRARDEADDRRRRSRPSRCHAAAWSAAA